MQSIFARYMAYSIDMVDQHCLLCKLYEHLCNIMYANTMQVSNFGCRAM